MCLLQKIFASSDTQKECAYKRQHFIFYIVERYYLQKKKYREIKRDK